MNSDGKDQAPESGQVGIVRQMAEYNHWMNRRLYDACLQLDADLLWRDLGAFFKSVMGTLNHIMVADLMWLNRFRGHTTGFPVLGHLNHFPQPKKLDQVLYTDLADLAAARGRLDQIIIDWVASLTAADLDTTLSYNNSRGESHHKKSGLLLTHLFNHQTHHRGQLTTLLSQQGIDPGVTDLVAILPEAD